MLEVCYTSSHLSNGGRLTCRLKVTVRRLFHYRAGTYLLDWLPEFALGVVREHKGYGTLCWP